MTFTPESLSRASATRNKRRLAREAATEPLDAGWLLFPDLLPGVGWILAPPSTDEHGVVTPGGGAPRRYYHSRDAAIQGRLRMKAYGYDPTQEKGVQ